MQLDTEAEFLSTVWSTRKVGAGLLVLILMVYLGWEQSVGRGPLRSNLSRRTVLGDLLEGAWG